MFYTYDQNNSGGSFDVDPAQGISVYVIVEADSPQEANSRAGEIGLYFNGCDTGWDCGCCGDRWYSAWGDGDSTPQVYGKDVIGENRISERIKWIDGPEGYIHYRDGRVESFWSERD